MAFRRLPFLLPALAALALPATAPAARGARPQFDARAGDHARVPGDVAAARRALADRLGLEGGVATDPRTGGLRLVARRDGFLSGRSVADPERVALAYVRAHANAFGLDGGDLAGLRLTARSTSPSGITHLEWTQTAGGIPAADSGVTVNVAPGGQVLDAGGAPVHDLAPETTVPALTVADAYARAQDDAGVPVTHPPFTQQPGPERRTHFDDGDTARLEVVADAGGDRLVWRILVTGVSPYVWDVRLDAQTGEVLARHSLTDFLVSTTVYDDHPGSPTQPGGRTATFPAAWLPNGSATLSGPNAHAYADVNANDSAGTGEDVTPGSYALAGQTPVSGQSCPRAFTAGDGGLCAWNGGAFGSTTANASEAANRSAATSNLFYLVNTFHDWLAAAPIGFTAASRNFEGGDPVQAEADDAGGTDNANFATPPDGGQPRMQMYLWKDGYPAVNGSFDASVVYHEYTHGLTNRLVGNGSGLLARQSQAMGEGWSDWYAMDYLADHGFVTDGAGAGDVVMGAYVTDNRTTGIRNNALDCPAGVSSSSCPGTSTAGAGGFTLGDMGKVGAYTASPPIPYFEVHDDGELWAETLWDLRTALGGATARGLITDALRLSPVNPSFLDMRDAILQADVAAGGAHHDQIWAVFAARGMGFSAKDVSADATEAVEAFDTPAVAATGARTVGGVASASNGNAVPDPGEAFTLAVTLRNPGAHAVTGVRATLRSGGPGAQVTVARANYGTIAAGASAPGDQAFVVAVPVSTACGTALPLSLDVASDQGTATLPVPVTVGASAAATPVSGAPASNIPAFSTGYGQGTIIVPVTAAAAGALTVTANVSHQALGDLQFRLTSPAGTTIKLADHPGRSLYSTAPSMQGTRRDTDTTTPITFDDAAATSVQDISDSATAGAKITAGPYRPMAALSSFAGQARTGTWTLRVQSLGVLSSAAGTLNSWSITFGDPSCSGGGPALPATTTGAATAGGDGSTTLGATVDPTGTATSVGFEYGETTAYGVATPAVAAGATSGVVTTSASVTGLTAGTTYHYRAVALRGSTPVAVGADATFVAVGGGTSGGGTTGGTTSGGGTTGGGTTGGTPSGGGTTGGGTAGGTPSGGGTTGGTTSGGGTSGGGGASGGGTSSGGTTSGGGTSSGGTTSGGGGTAGGGTSSGGGTSTGGTASGGGASGGGTSSGGTASGGGASGGGATHRVIALAGLPRSVTVDRRGRLRLTFRVSPGRLAGRIALTSASRVLARAGSTRSRFALGGARFTASAGGRVTVRITLSPAGAARLRRLRAVRVHATLSAGAHRVTATLIVHAPRA